mmetsp:Transcript_17568/g.40557  ORF Transcript_17568/g.40557 Transcript_17568/m.40557 type:complete len:216 (+) Transcript_17568:853-1500(+)
MHASWQSWEVQSMIVGAAYPCTRIPQVHELIRQPEMTGALSSPISMPMPLVHEMRQRENTTSLPPRWTWATRRILQSFVAAALAPSPASDSPSICTLTAQSLISKEAQHTSMRAFPARSVLLARISVSPTALAPPARLVATGAIPRMRIPSLCTSSGSLSMYTPASSCSVVPAGHTARAAEILFTPPAGTRIMMTDAISKSWLVTRRNPNLSNLP